MLRCIDEPDFKVNAENRKAESLINPKVQVTVLYMK